MNVSVHETGQPGSNESQDESCGSTISVSLTELDRPYQFHVVDSIRSQDISLSAVFVQETPMKSICMSYASGLELEVVRELDRDI